MMRKLWAPAFALLVAGAAPGAERRVTILQTTDLHGHAAGAGHVGAGPADLGGYARIAGYVEQVRASCGHPVLLVDSGDWSMGTLYDLTLARRPLALRFADALRYDCITLGNHEFDHTSAGLAGTLRAADPGSGLRTPIVASNLEAHGDPDLTPFVGPGKAIRGSLVKTLPNGLRVGFIGLMGLDAAGVAPGAAPVRFTDYSRDYARVQEQVDRLRAQGCRLIVALDHAGTDAEGRTGEDIELARHVSGIDVIASGHAHNPLDSARTVRNGAWATRIFCAGAFGGNVARMDLAFPEGPGAPRLEASGNLAMTDAALAGLDPPARPDPAIAALVAGADLELNRDLAPVFTRLARFRDYAPDDPARGIYHPVASCARALRSNGRDPMPAPNGLGDLCADALRATANGLPAGADPTPCTAAALATGELRGALEAGPAITFADLYGLLPLGRSPDPAQRATTGEPLVSGYVEAGALRALCAMQLLAQSGLAGTDDYVNLSGFGYTLNTPETAAFFAWASAATALRRTLQRAAEGSVPAAQALAALSGQAGDQGAALLRAADAGNPYAAAMVRLDDPDPARIPEHLDLLAQLARAQAQDPAGGSGPGLEALVLARAMAAIGPLSGFSPADPACTGPARPLAPGRQRIVLDRYLLLMVDSVRCRYGFDAAVYQSARGGRTLSGTPDGLKAILENRISLDPGGAFQEVKGWMALLAYLTRGAPFRGGRIPPGYDSTGDFNQFPAFGAAVRIRNAAYPRRRIAALAALAAALGSAP